MAKDIQVNYTIGDQTKRLQITISSQGTGQIMMDNYYHGQVVFSQNQWWVSCRKKQIKQQR